MTLCRNTITAPVVVSALELLYFLLWYSRCSSVLNRVRQRERERDERFYMFWEETNAVFFIIFSLTCGQEPSSSSSSFDVIFIIVIIITIIDVITIIIIIISSPLVCMIGSVYLHDLDLLVWVRMCVCLCVYACSLICVCTCRCVCLCLSVCLCLLHVCYICVLVYTHTHTLMCADYLCNECVSMKSC